MKRKGKIILFIISVVAIVVAVAAAVVIRGNSVVGGLTVNIKSAGYTSLISRSEMERSILEEFPGITSRRVRDVNTKSIESFMAKNPYVESVHAAVSVGGRVLVNIVARRPIVRVFYDNRDFYMDGYGHCFASRVGVPCDVPVANGVFRQRLKGEPESLDISKMASDTLKSAYDIVGVWKLAKFLDDSKQGYSLLFDQIYVDDNGDLLLQPRLFNHEVVIGSPDKLEDKFARLKIFYAKGLPHAGYDSYSRVSVKFDGQVVCTKRKQIK